MNPSPLIGRQSEQSQLSKTFKRAAAGHGQLMLLAGEAGMGKTRLANHMMENTELFTLGASANETATPPTASLLMFFGHI